MKKISEENNVNVNETGEVIVSENVVASIAKNAIEEIPEVHCVVGSESEEAAGKFLEILTNKATGKDKGIKVSIKDKKELYIEVFVVLKYGTNLINISKQIQEKIKESVESIVGLHVMDIDVYIEGVFAE